MKKIIYILLILSIAGLITIFAAAKIRSSKVQPQTYYKLPPPQDSLIKIGMIGDSWASFALQYQFNNYVDSLLSNHNIQSRTYIKGYPGAKIKQIYMNMFSEDSTKSTKCILQQRLHYCIVSGGINDLHGQYGEEYYRYHLLLIIKTLLHYNIKPIILEIPYFYNQEQYKVYSFSRQTAYRILSLANSHRLQTDNLLRYREEITQALKNEHLLDKVIYISTDSILKNNKNLYIDNMHINKEGYDLLGDRIVQQIIKDMNIFSL